jgi:hypothetical protein
MTFKDDGKGMTPLELHKMLSFGHCDKVRFRSKPIARVRRCLFVHVYVCLTRVCDCRTSS